MKLFGRGSSARDTLEAWAELIGVVTVCVLALVIIWRSC